MLEKVLAESISLLLFLFFLQLLAYVACSCVNKTQFSSEGGTCSLIDVSVWNPSPDILTVMEILWWYCLITLPSCNLLRFEAYFKLKVSKNREKEKKKKKKKKNIKLKVTKKKKKKKKKKKRREDYMCLMVINKYNAQMFEHCTCTSWNLQTALWKKKSSSNLFNSP